MSNPFQLIIPLKQHTPIIHFQHDQAGATLRAPEVKPKLDKYLIEHAFDSDALKYARFLVGGAKATHKALDYKLAIKSAGHRYEVIRKGNRDTPMFFANMGSEYKERGLVWNNDISLCIHCFHSELRDLIDSHIGRFIASTNFGMRSTKGFGSFTLATNAPAPANAYHFTVDANDWKAVFRTIDLFYKSIRGGINDVYKDNYGEIQKGLYMKPMIFEYARQKNVTWEKKTIKARKFPRKLADHQADHEGSVENQNEWPLWVLEPKERIVRDLLGLSTDQTWRGYPGGANGAMITKEHITKDIDRFPSPIIFKPVLSDNVFTVYFWAVPIADVYLDASFNISVNKAKIGSYPIWKEFDIDYFLKTYLSVEKLKAAMQYDRDKQRQRDMANKLIRIYSEIEKNKPT